MQLSVTTDYAIRATLYLLKKRGIVRSCEIVKTAQEITLWDVIEATESTTKINRCLGKGGYCNRDGRSSCPVRKVYSVLQEAMEERLITIKMKDLMNDKKSKNEIKEL